jgi:DNA-directed RNA polymerase specialized sigma24 family protein
VGTQFALTPTPPRRAVRRPLPRCRTAGGLLAKARQPDSQLSVPEQNYLAGLVRLGRDPAGDAYQALALSVVALVRGKAAHYARAFGCDPGDLESEGLLALPYAVRYYRPRKQGKNGFVNFFTFCAARRIKQFAEKSRSRPELTDCAGYLAGLTTREEPVNEAADAVREALAGLDPIARDIVEHAHQFHGKRQAIRTVGGRHGLNPAESLALYRDAIARLSLALAGVAEARH